MERNFLLQLTVFIALYVVGVIGARRPSYRNDAPVIGGKLVKPIDAGWQAAVIHKRRLICGGSLLDDDVVLTAASCIKGLEPADMQVRAGTINFKNGGQVRKIRETIHHPGYDAETLAYDVALLHLMRPFNATESHLRLIELPDDKNTELPNVVTVYGWGTSGRKHNTTMTKNIRSSKSKIYSLKRCAQFLPDRDMADMFFCAGDRVKRVDICNDDLGGPAFSDGDIQIGIISESSGCSSNRHTTIFTKTLTHKKWIEDTMAEIKAPKGPPKPKARRG